MTRKRSQHAPATTDVVLASLPGVPDQAPTPCQDPATGGPVAVPAACQQGANAPASEGATAPATPDASASPGGSGITAAPADADAVVGWTAAAVVAGRPEITLRRLVAAGKLAADKGEDGVYRFEKAELEALRPPGVARFSVTAACSTTPRPTTPCSNGEMAALAFAAFAKGHDPRMAVVELKREPEAVRAWWNQWVEMGQGDLVIPSAFVRDLENVLGPLPSAKVFMDTVFALLLDHWELQDLTYTCPKCGKLVTATCDAEWDWLVDHGHLASWHHLDCDDPDAGSDNGENIDEGETSDDDDDGGEDDGDDDSE